MFGSARSVVAVPKNEWSRIEVPELGAWSPTLSVSVVIPYYERSHELDLTLAGLAQQTYPASLMQVIVVDDGSPTDPPRIPSGLPFELEVKRQEDLGYGLARARNLGAKVAEGEAVVFLDCDMIPEKQHIEAHSRWFHSASRLLTVGFRFHAEFADISADQVAKAVGQGDLVSLVGERSVQRPEWIEGHIDRTDNFQGAVEDLYLVMSGGNLGVDRLLYLEAGGNDESFVRWGGEDNEFAYRALQLGAVVVPERKAIAWHQGEGHEPDESELNSIRLQRQTMKNLIADRSMRPWQKGRQYALPYLLVEVDSSGSEAEVVGLTIDSILASDFTDLVIGVPSPENGDDATWLIDSYRSDPRVIIGTSMSGLIDRYPFSPARFRLPGGWAVDEETLSSLMGELGGPGVGAIHLTLPGKAPYEGFAEVTLTKAANRVRHLDEKTRQIELGRMFGERWKSGASAGIWQIEDVEQGLARLKEGRDQISGGAMELVSRQQDQIAALQGRRALKIADALGSISSARSWADVRFGVSALRKGLGRRTP